MQIKNATFITSAASSADFAKFDLPEIAVAGRSNAGKSSFINLITGNGSLARTSKEAGKTRNVNFYKINAQMTNDTDNQFSTSELTSHFTLRTPHSNEKFTIFHLTDLPGYGYSAAGKAATEKFSALADEYIRTSPNLVHVLLLVDIQIPPQTGDLELAEYLYRNQKPFTILAVKADKLSRAKAENQRSLIARHFKIGRDDVIAVSNTTGEGARKITELFDRILLSVDSFIY